MQKETIIYLDNDKKVVDSIDKAAIVIVKAGDSETMYYTSLHKSEPVFSSEDSPTEEEIRKLLENDEPIIIGKNK